MVNLDTIYDMLTSIQKLEKVTELKEETFGTLRLIKHEPLELKINELFYNVNRFFSLQLAMNEKVGIAYSDKNDALSIINSICGFIPVGPETVFWNKLPIGNFNLENLRQHIVVFDGHIKWLDLPIHDNIDLNINKRDKIDAQILKYTGLISHIEKQENGLDATIYNSALKDYSAFSYSTQLARILSADSQCIILLDPFVLITEAENKALADYIINIKNKTILIFTNYDYFLKQTNSNKSI
jgi:ATP-binding cassette, subfamily B, bacterial